MKTSKYISAACIVLLVGSLAGCADSQSDSALKDAAPPPSANAVPAKKALNKAGQEPQAKISGAGASTKDNEMSQ